MGSLSHHSPQVTWQGVSVQGGLCPGGLCPWGSITGGLCPKGSLLGRPPDRDSPSRMVKTGRYASYLNAFLFYRRNFYISVDFKWNFSILKVTYISKSLHLLLNRNNSFNRFYTPCSQTSLLTSLGETFDSFVSTRVCVYWLYNWWSNQVNLTKRVRSHLHFSELLRLHELIID